MATNAQDQEQHETVQDDGTVDKKLKDRIINARERVDDREDYLYVQATVDANKHIEPAEQTVYWGMVVKQYLRTIEPLLNEETVSEADKFYTAISIGEVTLLPQDTPQYPFSAVARGDIEPMQFKIQYDLPRSVELPEPKTVEFEGLQSVIERGPMIGETWEVETNVYSDPREGRVVRTQDQRPIPKQIYEDAVRIADRFLQQAGIGLELGVDGQPAIGSFDQSGDEPSSTGSTAQVTDSPDL